jgi:polyhydroxyalkanoate synthesis regulator phasin
MPKKKNQESQEEQSERFKKTVAELVAAGELDPTEANTAFDNLMKKVKVESDRGKSATNDIA